MAKNIVSPLKKISVAKVCGRVKTLIKKLDEGQEMLLMQVGGVMHDTKTGESDLGPWTALKGQFIAIDLTKPEQARYRSSVCFLPEVALDDVMAVFSQENVESLEFGFLVGARVNNTEVGYEYFVTPLIESNQSDPLEALLTKMPEPPKIEYKKDGEKEKTPAVEEKPAKKAAKK